MIDFEELLLEYLQAYDPDIKHMEITCNETESYIIHTSVIENMLLYGNSDVLQYKNIARTSLQTRHEQCTF